MSMRETPHTPVVTVDTEEELRAIVGEPSPRAFAKQRTTLHEHDRTFIARSPMLLLATAAADGSCDVSPRGDAAGFVQPLDDTTLAIPDRPGNRRVDSFRNILANPQVALWFCVPNVEETLRINGVAHLVREAPFLDEMAVRGRRPSLALVVTIEEIYFHCGKALRRAKLWHSDTWPDRAELPTLGRIMVDQRATESSVAEMDAYYRDSYRNTLY
ncbi:pyridoxamine 5'-phosphate oxidase family protein [Salinactinospora qingdaonensis]|uniref:Pyridoxamine 5'-phosphate oxidase family protein n=1 Tax=Salinactinospora qingdaonensis TaxID=702744 RepID=A0ABP7EZR1_9ACTN